MKKIYPEILIVMIFCLVLSGCNLAANAAGTPDLTNQQTSVAQTIAVLETQMSATTPTPPSIATNTPETQPSPEFTTTLALPADTSTPVPTPSPSYRIGTVADVTYPDNTVVKPGQTFTKTWKLTNGGTGTWNSNFRLVFVSGDAMGGPASKTLNQSVAPGASIQISVDLKAPSTSGKTYQGKWMLQTDNGTTFGLGANADGVFWVLVKVDQPFVITGATTVASPTSYTGTCPTNIVFTANVTATTSGTATYYFVTSLGNSPSSSLPFTAAGTVTTGTFTVSVPSSQTVTVAFYNDYPNHQDFGTISVVVTCTP